MGRTRFSRTSFKLLAVFAAAAFTALGINFINPQQVFALQCPAVQGLDSTTPPPTVKLNGNLCTFSNVSAKDPSSPDCGSNYSRVLQSYDCQTNAVPDGSPPPPPPGTSTTCKGSGDHYDQTLAQCVHNPTATDPATGQPKCDAPYVLVQNTLCATAPTNSNYTGHDNNQADPNEADPCPVSDNLALRWLACPVFEMMKVATDGLDSFIDEYMTVGNRIFDCSGATYTATGGSTKKCSETQYKAAWSTFRNFGIALVLIAGLVMLVSEGLGLSIVDAYTVRKVLPRLLVAIIGISLSWELCKFIITFFDDIGHAIRSIIYTSFGHQNTRINIAALLAVSWGGTAAAGFAAWAILGPFGLLSLAGTLVLAMLVGAAVLVLRQAIIVAAVLLSPLAIAAYVLPNTSKLADFWWDTLTRMLMLYPLAAGLIALCKVMGEITLSNPVSGPLDTLISTVVGMLFFFAGYALIPVAFRLAGGLVATLGGMANDRSRGAFDRLKGFRKNTSANNLAALGRGERFKGNTKIGERMNNFSRGATTFAQTRYKGAFLTNKTARATAMAERDEALRQERMKSAAGMGNMFNDESLQAQASGDTEQEARANLQRFFNMSDEDADKAIAKAKANGGFSKIARRSAVVQLAATGTGYENVAQMAQVAAAASGGDAGVRESLVGAIRQTGGGGRYDLAGMGHSTLSGLIKSSEESGGAAGPDGKLVQDALVEAARSTNASKLLSGKAKGTSHIANALTTSLQEAQQRADNTSLPDSERELARQYAAELSTTISNMKGAAPFATEVNLSAMHTNRTSVMQGFETAKKREDPENQFVVPGNVGFENPTVERHLRVISNQVSQPERVPDRDSSGKIQRDSDGVVKTKENPNYDPSYELAARAARRNSQARGGGMDQFDPRRDEAA